MKTNILFLLYGLVVTLAKATEPIAIAEKRKAEAHLIVQLESHLESTFTLPEAASEEAVEIMFTINEEHRLQLSQVKTPNRILRQSIVRDLHNIEAIHSEVLEGHHFRLHVHCR